MKNLHWLGSARKDLKAMPDEVQDTFGYALHLAQMKSTHGIATPKPDMDLIQMRLKAAEMHYRGETR